jgi:hypothetical protein
VIVAAVAVRMVQMAINEITDMLAMWHRLVPTIGAVPVKTLVTAAIVVGCAAFRVFCTYFQDMFFNKRRAGGANRIYLRRNVR